ncbi:Short-chain dehydrogenase [Georgenia satyanarayanai]|uniref:Short-chain dehydrogenase n=1 Tax=Georgenia satyanarayanai TaxID=860221 RepID=A0A2Y9AEE3_9MICO|nr:SDR family oxidoreductase [Georgenia satyanarayanai]PYG00301.1 short-subunit dehydrogenase [Georgenia satyanarayanai]SSA40687.1 Short-chain dehydrogenase [Georgenia satyanarayanai]
MRVKGCVVVVTGASSGIGRATALRFAREGADVVLAARRGQALETVAEQCRRHGVRALPVVTDVTDAAAVDRLAQQAVTSFGRIDAWVNIASVTVFGPLLATPMEDVRRVVDVNVMGYVHGARAALEHMRRQGSGVLVNVSSVVGEIPQPYTPAYSMAKAAVRALSVSLRSELWLDGARDIHVVTVLPATYDTPFFQQAANYSGRRAQPIPPLYAPPRAARGIVGAVRRPRREVTVGAGGRLMRAQHRVAPALTETMMAVLVDRTHLSRTHSAPPTSGNLYEPSSDERLAQVTGGWGGRRRTAVRTLAGAGALVGGGLALRRLRR